MRGSLCSDTAVVLTTSWQAVAVTERAADLTSQQTPALGGGHGWSIEASLSIVGSATTMQFAVTYDSGATKTYAGPSGNQAIANLTGTRGVASVSIDTPFVWPTGVSPSTLYVWVKADSAVGTPTIAANGLRLVYTDSSSA